MSTDPVFSTLATPLKTPFEHYHSSAYHDGWVKDHGRDIDYRTACARYNAEELGAGTVEGLPHRKHVLVVGAGPSLTMATFREAMRAEPDAVLLTVPLVRAFADRLEAPGWYVVDAEIDMFIVPHYYGTATHDCRLICPSIKHLEHNFASIHTYPMGMEWPRSSGAVALKVAFDVMRAERVDVVGIDLTGHHERFTDETRPYLERATCK